MSSLSPPSTTGREYWRSLEDLAQTPQFREFMHREFPAGASELLDSDDRRHFLKIMGASMALAGLGLAGCRRWPEEVIAPYAARPADRTPGVPVHYSTCMELAGVAHGLLATSYDGRPVKIEGNPDHPTSGGATSAFAQASVLDLYDPDRSRGVRRDGEPSDWAAFVSWLTEHGKTLTNTRGRGLHILAEASSSPTVALLRTRLLERYPRAVWHEYEPIHRDNVSAGAELAFGSPYRALHDFEAARVVVSLDADFLLSHPNAVANTRGFARSRAAEDPARTMSRLYQFESTLSLTGANADERAALRSADVALAAAWLAARILGDDDALRRFEAHPRAASVLTADVLSTLEHALADLQAHRGDGIVIAGDRQPAEVHLLAHLMNEALGNAGRTVSYIALESAPRDVDSIRTLAEAMQGRRVDTLLILGGNPVYTAPVDLDFAAALGQVPNAIHLSDYVDETSALCAWHLNRAHYLEAWGDGRSWDGTVSVCQPLIRPLFEGRSSIEVLAVLAGDDLLDGADLVRRTYADLAPAGQAEAAWRRMLHDGRLADSAARRQALEVYRDNVPAAVTALLERWSDAGDGVEVVFAQDASTYDGRFGNNGWMQELPDPITKLTWDNAVLMSPAAAASLGVSAGDLVTLSVGERSLPDPIPVLLVPGHADGSVTVPLGYGRRMEGRICAGAGFDAYALRTSGTMDGAAGTIARAGGHHPLATTQDHHAIDVEGVAGKGIQQRLPTLVREGDVREYREHPRFVRHRTHVVHRLSQFPEDHPHQDEGGAQYAWAMAIDLNKCTGCNACVVACQAENNIPIVGKDQVLRGREMHWLRIDRYYKFGRDEEGRLDGGRLQAVAVQPVMCVHCENAPCEQVCPVAATVHDEDGLNVMVYNRCIGTRYCSNNCPYKVRRFNYFDYHRREPARKQPGVLLQVQPDYYERAQAMADPIRQMQFNPEVTVRVRGVMEKCTYCVQRISRARIEAKNGWVQEPEAGKRRAERVPVPDTIDTACSQACPAEAIVFGDLNDPESRVRRQHGHDRAYEMLEELNVKPRTKYLAKLRNPAAPSAPTGGQAEHGDEGHG